MRMGTMPRARRARGRMTTALLLAVAVGALLAPLVAAQPVVRPPWRSQAPELATAAITVGDVPLTVELAIEPGDQARGLGYRPGLKPGTGMLFVDREPSIQSFWMKGMRFCLDIVWIEGGQIVGAAESVCPAAPGTPDEALPVYRSPGPVRYVLEVPAGWLAAHRFGAGTPVVLPAEVAPATPSS
jgi:uncharacterized membrane protein (UPF0127 family)